MKILVTGAAGFIGSHLSKALLARGDEVVGLDNFDPYYDLALKQSHLAALNHSHFRLVRGDLRDEILVRELFETERFDAVAHIGAMAAVRYSVQFPLLYSGVNVQGTVNLLDAARQTSRPRCVLASTGSVYGRDTPVPFSEEASAVLPLAPYPASKRAMELFAHSFAHLYGLHTTILRFFNVYGPHGRPDMMPWQWTQKISRREEITLFNGGHLKRDWTYIDDIVDGFLAALDANLQWEIFNLGCGVPVENKRFVQILELLVGERAWVVDAPCPASEPLETFADISKARRMLGYAPQVEVAQGLKQFVDWMRQEHHI
ncbi:UDP-glucuronate 4-epimerase [Abditibacterium utsteinense]|uniref:UDP-glucuronate 4-epimerase n=1 Tax=Abditibacterium utsteinense TaxID=1960156 RepID=A0A2S8SXE6_9BACT|nr:NAD-dependent epimerase/dehydratase family protein [Abditibacterium utsteinense]PQV65464.1 UDP-glucuronate 4-epimerase [Abditibacterium utsteinense]